jgi:transcriptional regulator with XRE-family HTH domain
VKELRRRSFPSQQSLAVRVKTSVRTVAHWEAGRTPGFRFLAYLADVAYGLGHGDLGSVFLDALQESPKKIMETVRHRNGRELGACLSILHAMRNEKFRRNSERALRELKPAIDDLAAVLGEDEISLSPMAEFFKEFTSDERHNNKTPKKKR